MADSKDLMRMLESTLAEPKKKEIEIEDTLPDAPMSRDAEEVYKNISKKRKKRRKAKQEESTIDPDDDLWINPLFTKQNVDLGEIFNNKGVVSQRPLSTAELALMLEEKEEEEENAITNVRLREKETYISGNSENKFTKEFAPELAQLYDTIENVQTLQDTLKKSFARESTRGRGSFNKNVNELIMNILQCDNTKLSLIKEINSTKKNIINLTNASEKDKGGTADVEFNANNFLKSIMGGVGRSNFISQINDVPNMGIGTQITSGTNEPVFNASDYDYERMDEIGDIVLGELSERPAVFNSEHDLYIKYESENPKICIRLLPGTDDWEFVVIGDNGHIPDYPVPNPIDVGALEYNDDKTIATSRSGERYEIISSYSSAEALAYEDEF